MVILDDSSNLRYFLTRGFLDFECALLQSQKSHVMFNQLEYTPIHQWMYVLLYKWL